MLHMGVTPLDKGEVQRAHTNIFHTVIAVLLSVSCESKFKNASTLPKSDMAPSTGEEFHTQRVNALGDGTCHIAHSSLCDVGCNWWGTLQCVTW